VSHLQPRGNPLGTRRRPPPDQGGHHRLAFIAFPQPGQLRRTGWQSQLRPVFQNQPLGIPLALSTSSSRPNYQSEIKRLKIYERIAKAKSTLEHVSSPAYRESLVGMIGADPALM
jgi:hypothetical protein